MALFGPRQTVLVTSRARAKVLGKDSEKDNIISVAWHMPLSREPLMYAVAIGKARFSHKLIHAGKAFCVNFIPYSMKDVAVACGTVSGEHTDKFAQNGLQPIECEKIDCSRIDGCLGWLECEVTEEVETGDHVIFIGKVVHHSELAEAKRLFHIGSDKFTTTGGKNGP